MLNSFLESNQLNELRKLSVASVNKIGCDTRKVPPALLRSTVLNRERSGLKVLILMLVCVLYLELQSNVC